MAQPCLDRPAGAPNDRVLSLLPGVAPPNLQLRRQAPQMAGPMGEEIGGLGRHTLRSVGGRPTSAPSPVAVLGGVTTTSCLL